MELTIENVASALHPHLVPVDSLTPDPNNARRHNKKSIEAVAYSLDRHGQQKPIVADRDRVVRAGNGMLMAAKSLGWRFIACNISDLSGSAATAYALADNRTAELSAFDYEVVSKALQQLAEENPEHARQLGWSDDELVPLLAATWSAPAVPPKDGGEGDDTPPPAPERQHQAIMLDPKEYRTFERAARQVRRQHGDTLSMGECVVKLAEAWLDNK